VDTCVKLMTCILDAAAHMKRSEDQLRQTIHDLALKVQSALMLMVGFFNIYYEL